MSIPASAYNYSSVLPGGELTLRALFETFIGSGVEQPVSDVEVTITPATGGDPVLGPTSDDVVQVDQATYEYRWLPPAETPPGDYEAVFTGQGPDGVLTRPLGVTVVAPPAESPSPGVYATIAQYRDEITDELTPDWLVTKALRRASMVIDYALIGAVYPTDDDSMPTVPAHIQLFMRATCAQAEWMLENNDLTGIKRQFSSTSMGGVSQTRTPSAQGGATIPLAPAAAMILQTDGAFPTAPLVNW